jgi:hypothetical protein
VNVKFIIIRSTGIRETLRDRKGFVLLLGLPELLTVLFAFAFGSGTFLSGGSFPHEVIINNDAGVSPAVNNTTQYVNYGTNFAGVLENPTAENSNNTTATTRQQQHDSNRCNVC